MARAVAAVSVFLRIALAKDQQVLFCILLQHFVHHMGGRESKIDARARARVFFVLCFVGGQRERN